MAFFGAPKKQKKQKKMQAGPRRSARLAGPDDDAAAAVVPFAKTPNTVSGFPIPRGVLSDPLHPAAGGFPSMLDLMREHDETDASMMAPLPALAHLVTDWIGREGRCHCRYRQFDVGMVSSTLQRSIVPRDGALDIIVSNIRACVERAGHGTAFMLALLEVARSLRPPRGVQLQQLITDASRGLATRLCATYNWRWSTDRMSVYSPASK